MVQVILQTELLAAFFGLLFKASPTSQAQMTDDRSFYLQIRFFPDVSTCLTLISKMSQHDT